MSEKLNPMDKFNFLLGTWKLHYKVLKSHFSDVDIGEGEGEFKRILKNKYAIHNIFNPPDLSASAIGG